MRLLWVMSDFWAAHTALRFWVQVGLAALLIGTIVAGAYFYGLGDGRCNAQGDCWPEY